VLSAGITWQTAGNGPFGAVRVRHFGTYPLIEDNSVRATPTTLVNAQAGYRFGPVQLVASLLNVFDTKASDIQYYYASRLPGEAPEGVSDVHFHPVEPRQLRIALGWGL
jgi:hypothetical protein